MGNQAGSLTVYFDDPFWVGVFERVRDGKLQVARVTFGAEPSDREILEFCLRHYHELEFSPAVAVGSGKERHVNPKRARREAARQMGRTGIGTKSQRALGMQHELLKAERKRDARERRREEAERRFELRQQKRKAKHRGK
ncbi:MAG: YjdF family protein [Bifidobacterium sp.]|nr:YjdF family protein [Bifidobacterium sp.]